VAPGDGLPATYRDGKTLFVSDSPQAVTVGGPLSVRGRHSVPSPDFATGGSGARLSTQQGWRGGASESRYELENRLAWNDTFLFTCCERRPISEAVERGFSPMPSACTRVVLPPDTASAAGFATVRLRWALPSLANTVSRGQCPTLLPASSSRCTPPRGAKPLRGSRGRRRSRGRRLLGLGDGRRYASRGSLARGQFWESK
jgi:hypothetical protein